jgi:rare lipoprotein A
MKKSFIFIWAILMGVSALAQENFMQEGIASFTSDEVQGMVTKSGTPFDNAQKVAAHPFLPMNTQVRVINLENGKAVEVKIIDRCTCQGRSINLSKYAASQIGLLTAGKARVKIESLNVLKFDEPPAVASTSLSTTPATYTSSEYREFREVSDESTLMHPAKSEALPETATQASASLATAPVTYSAIPAASDNFQREGVYNYGGKAQTPRGVGLQVGVYTTLKGLKTVCEELSMNGIAPAEIFIQVMRRDANTSLYKVLVGTFDAKSPAVGQKLKHLSNKGYKPLVKTYL